MKGENMRRLLVLLLVALMALIAAGVSSAGRTQQTLNCSGLGTITVTVTSTKNDHSVAWGTGKVSNRLHGIPVRFSGSVTDVTTNTLLFSFSQAKGKGHGMHRQRTVTCTSPPVQTTAALAGIPGVNPSDTVEMDFTAQVVIKSHKH
jgi:hypothetical protein